MQTKNVLHSLSNPRVSELKIIPVFVTRCGINSRSFLCLTQGMGLTPEGQILSLTFSDVTSEKKWPVLSKKFFLSVPFPFFPLPLLLYPSLPLGFLLWSSPLRPCLSSPSLLFSVLPSPFRIYESILCYISVLFDCIYRINLLDEKSVHIIRADHLGLENMSGGPSREEALPLWTAIDWI